MKKYFAVLFFICICSTYAQKPIPVQSELIKQYIEYHKLADNIEQQKKLATAKVSSETRAINSLMRHLKKGDKARVAADIKSRKRSLKYSEEEIVRVEKSLKAMKSDPVKRNEMLKLSRESEAIQAKIRVASKPFDEKTTAIKDSQLKPFEEFLAKELKKVFVIDGKLCDKVEIQAYPTSGFAAISWKKNGKRIAWSHASYKKSQSSMALSKELGIKFSASSYGSRWAVSNLSGNLSISDKSLQKKELMQKYTGSLINTKALIELDKNPRMAELVQIHNKINEIGQQRSKATKELYTQSRKYYPQISKLRKEGFVDENTFTRYKKSLTETKNSVERYNKEITYLENYDKYASKKEGVHQ